MGEMNEEQMDRVVEDLLRGRRLRAGVGAAGDQTAIMAAAALAASREGHPRMSSAMRKRLTSLVSAAPADDRLNRRAALAAVAGLAVGAAGALGLGRLVGGGAPAAPAESAPSGILRPVGALRWLPVGALAEFGDGTATPVVAGSVSAYVFREGATVSAISATCSHLPCALDWRSGSRLLYCPCHQKTFAPDGTPTDANYEIPRLPSVRVKVEDGQVYVMGR